MIGNDIVDLRFMSQSVDWNRPRFLDKVCTKQEQSLIFDSGNKTQTFWRLWSMKEAAYKVYIQENNERFFNPKAFQCKLFSSSSGRVKIYDQHYFTISECNLHFVFSTATKAYKEKQTSAWFYTDKTSYAFQSRFLRQKFLEYISKSKRFELKTLSVKKNKRNIPEVFESKEPFSFRFSLTHCGHYSGFSITE